MEISDKKEINEISKSKAEDAELTKEMELNQDDVYRIMEISYLKSEGEY